MVRVASPTANYAAFESGTLHVVLRVRMSSGARWIRMPPRFGFVWGSQWSLRGKFDFGLGSRYRQ